MHPKDAGLDALRRVAKNTVEKRLLDERGRPNFGLNFYILNRKGEYAGVTMHATPRSRFAVCDENGPRAEPLIGLYEREAAGMVPQ